MMDVLFRYCLHVHMSKQSSQHCNKDQDQQMLGSVLQTFEEQPSIVHHPPTCASSSNSATGRSVTLSLYILSQSCDITTRSFVTMLSNISNRPRYPSFAARLYGAACPLQSLLPSLISVALICHCYAGFGRTTPSLFGLCAFASKSFTLGCVLKHSFSCTSHICLLFILATGTETFC